MGLRIMVETKKEKAKLENEYLIAFFIGFVLMVFSLMLNQYPGAIIGIIIMGAILYIAIRDWRGRKK